MNAPASSLPSTIAKNDFADWLSPILVKELRQGLRTRVFTSTFILLQVVLTGCVFVGLLVAANGGNTSASTGFFWGLIGVPLLLILPWAGMNAISNEVKANTLDLIFLTRLSAWRIVLGKWIAIVAQSALLLAAVLPYVVLRYFMGGIDLAAELLALLVMFVASALVSAMLVGLSAYPGRLMRIVVVIGMLIGMQALLPILLFVMMGPMSGLSGMPGIAGWTALLLGMVLAVVAALALDFGAARIAPAAENHAARKRIFGFVILLIAAGAAAWDPHSQLITIITLVAVTPTIAGGLCEAPSVIPSVYRPFARRGLAGRALGRLLYPGWASGVVYAVLILAGFAGVLAQNRAFTTWWSPILYASFCGALLVPAALLRIFARPIKGRALIFFVGLQAGGTAIAVALRIIDSVTDGGASLFLTFFPTCTLIVIGTSGLQEQIAPFIMALTVAVTAVGTLLLLILALFAFKRMSVLERASIAEPVPPNGVA